MSYFAPYLDETGLHIPTYTDIRDYFIAGYRNIFGSDIYLGEDSQDYEMISLYAKAMDDFAALAVDCYNSRNPNYASGTNLDLLLPINGIKRNPATYSTVTLTLTGLEGSALSSGMLARDQSGYSWQLLSAVTFDGQGSATVNAMCTQAGAIAAPANTITIIETPTSNWYSVTNPSDAVLGRNVETDAAVRVRRAKSVAVSATSTLDGIVSALVNLTGVTHVAVRENYTDETDQTTGLPPHSVCALVSGGDANQIAATVFRKKAPGIATYGNESVIYTDAYGRDNTVYFSRPVETLVSINVTLRTLYGWDANNMPDAIKANLIAYVDSIGIGDPLVVSALWGETFKASEGTSPAFSVLSITAQIGENAAVSDVIDAGFSAKFYTDASHINITIQGV